MPIYLFRNEERMGEAREFSTFPLRTRNATACTFWSAADIAPGDVVELHVEAFPPQKILIVARPAGGDEEIRVSAIVLGLADGDGWRSLMKQMTTDPALMRLLDAELSRGPRGRDP